MERGSDKSHCDVVRFSSFKLKMINAVKLI